MDPIELLPPNQKPRVWKLRGEGRTDQGEAILTLLRTYSVGSFAFMIWLLHNLKMDTYELQMSMNLFKAVRPFLFIMLLVPAMLFAEEIPLIKSGGIYRLPVEVNGVITLNLLMLTEFVVIVSGRP